MDIPSFYTDIDQGIADIREIARHFVGKYKVIWQRPHDW